MADIKNAPPLNNFRYGWRWPKRCKTCQYRATAEHGYSCDYAMITESTRTGEYMKKYGKNFSRALLEPEHCEFYTNGQKLYTKQVATLEGQQRTMKQLEDTFMRLYKLGMTDAEIGNQIHKSETIVKKFRNSKKLKANVKPTPLTEELCAAIEELYNTGLNDAETARRLGVTSRVVSGWRYKYGKKANCRQGGGHD